jgi:ribosomal protein S18 acetylase RimI-like enzyme
VQLLRHDQQEAAAQTLAEAFADDALLEIVAPDPAKRAKHAAWFMGVPVRYAVRHGRVWANDDVSAVAAWANPDGGSMSAGRMLRAGMWALPLKLGLTGMNRFSAAMAATQRFHEQVGGPHWYLITVGTRRSRQGQGLGGQLLELGTSQADAASLPCYLETATESNIAFYAKRGFEVIGQAEVLGHTLTGMVRKPR